MQLQPLPRVMHAVWLLPTVAGVKDFLMQHIAPNWRMLLPCYSQGDAITRKVVVDCMGPRTDAFGHANHTTGYPVRRSWMTRPGNGTSHVHSRVARQVPARCCHDLGLWQSKRLYSDKVVKWCGPSQPRCCGVAFALESNRQKAISLRR